VGQGPRGRSETEWTSSSSTSQPSDNTTKQYNSSAEFKTVSAFITIYILFTQITQPGNIVRKLWSDNVAKRLLRFAEQLYGYIGHIITKDTVAYLYLVLVHKSSTLHGILHIITPQRLAWRETTTTPQTPAGPARTTTTKQALTTTHSPQLSPPPPINQPINQSIKHAFATKQHPPPSPLGLCFALPYSKNT
jgi:hypothetical protein